MRRDPDALGARFDLVVIGAGCTGAGVALDAALRGLRVALVDKGDFASGTSSISTKLVHGGLRYLEHGEIGLVYEALHERRRLLRLAPHLVKPLRFTIPFYTGSRMPAWKWRAGLLLYDILAGPGNLHRSGSLLPARLLAEMPALCPEGLTGGATYFDASMDDARLLLEIVRGAAEHGAVVCNYVEVLSFEDRETLRCLDHVSGREVIISGRVILNAAGPWSDAVRRLAGEQDGPRLAPTKGVHLVVPNRGLSSALLLLHPHDGRVFFVLPWLGKTLIGTTDTEFTGSPDSAGVTDEDIDYLLDGHNRYLAPALSRGDILGHFAGLRPLVRGRPGEPSARSREWRLLTGSTGLLSAVGGKWTTYRYTAEVITDMVMRQLGRKGSCRTRTFALGAPRGDWSAFASAAVTALCQRYGLTPESAKHLVRRYGRRVGEVARMLTPELMHPVIEGEPDLRVEFAYQREQEMAIRPEDSLLRRTRLGLFHPDLLRQTPRERDAGE